MTIEQHDDIGEAILRLEQATADFEQDASESNRETLHAEVRALLKTFVDESLYAVEVDGRHQNVKELLTRASELMSAHPDELSAQVVGYTNEIMSFNAEEIQRLLASARLAGTGG